MAWHHDGSLRRNCSVCFRHTCVCGFNICPECQPNVDTNRVHPELFHLCGVCWGDGCAACKQSGVMTRGRITRVVYTVYSDPSLVSLREDVPALHRLYARMMDLGKPLPVKDPFTSIAFIESNKRFAKACKRFLERIA